MDMPTTTLPLVCVVHGGAGTIVDSARDTAREGVKLAADAGLAVLLAGGSAIAAVVAATKVLEDHRFFNAGTGSVLNNKGFVEMDALVMSGDRLRVGAVTGVRRTKNPVCLAEAVLHSSPHVFLSGDTADEFAAGVGLQQVEPDDLITAVRREQLKLVRSICISKGYLLSCL
jgi:beta-aspartyl-peptidase (threonine type)